MKINKYGAKRTRGGDGRNYDSRAEARRSFELQLLQTQDLISDLQFQVPFNLEVNGILIGKYVADFTYYQNGKYIVEDKKGVKTPLFKWKMKHLKAQYGIDVYIT